MGEVIGAAVIACGTFLVAALLRRRFKLNAIAATAMGLMSAVTLGAGVLLVIGIWEDHQRGIQRQADAKRICMARAALNAELAAQGKPPLHPNVKSADCLDH